MIQKPSVLFVDDYIDVDLGDLSKEQQLETLCVFANFKMTSSSPGRDYLRKAIAERIGDFDWARSPWEAALKMQERQWDLVCLDGGFDWIWEIKEEDNIRIQLPKCVLPMSSSMQRNLKTIEACKRLDIPVNMYDHAKPDESMFGFHFQHYYEVD